ncbi:MAG: hypothetical protein AAB243_00270, partial [Planctomycetota bacterium]
FVAGVTTGASAGFFSPTAAGAAAGASAGAATGFAASLGAAAFVSAGFDSFTSVCVVAQELNKNAKLNNPTPKKHFPIIFLLKR